MAGKRKTNLKSPKKLDLKALKPGDVLCPICRTILIEPVTLPCNHAFCNACFKDTMENANLVCPLCRTRVGSWYRKTKKANLVDEAFWSAIKDSFPQEVQNKYDGLDSGIEEDRPVIVVADPGEIRKEYETERKKDEKERRKLQELEEKASADLINKIREEEDYRKMVEEEKLKLDAELARKLAEEQLPSTSKQKKTPTLSLGPLDKFLQRPSNNAKSTKKSSNTKKEYSSGVLCLDKFPKNKHNGTSNLVMPVVQKKIQQIHKILETEERKNTKQVASSSAISTHLDGRFHFKPIEVYKRSPVDKKMSAKIPVKVPYRRVTVDVNIPILSPIGRKPDLETRFSAFSRFSFSEESRPPVSQTVEQSQTSQKINKNSLKESSLKKLAIDKPHRNLELMEDEHEISSKKSQNNNYFTSPQRKIARKIFQRKNSTIGSGDESPFLGFYKSKNIKNVTSEVTNTTQQISLDDSLAETFIGWPETISPGTEKSNSIKRLNKINNSNNLTTLNDSNGSKTLDTKAFLGWSQKNPKSRTEKTLERSSKCGSIETKTPGEESRNSIKKINKVNSTVSHNNLKSLIDTCNSMSETFLGWDQPKTPKRKAKEALKKSSKTKKCAIKSQALSSPYLSSITLSSDGSKDNFNESITEPLLGFQISGNNHDVDLNSSLTEPFTGFNNSEKVSCAVLTGLNNGELSPEISTSQIRQDRKPRTHKKNDKTDKVINGLSPGKKRNLKTTGVPDKKRKLQEESDFELAKRLQAQFDDFATPKRTRRGTERQVTLDEMFAL